MDVLAGTLSQLRSRRAVWFAILSVAMSTLILPRPSSGKEVASESGSSAVTIKIEAESYWWAHNAGGEPISIGTCAGNASGGKTVIGLDYPGDWIMMEAKVLDPLFFKISLRAAEDMGLRAKFAIEFVPLGPGVIPAADTLMTAVGRGAG
jgi:hypothetical protein